MANIDYVCLSRHARFGRGAGHGVVTRHQRSWAYCPHGVADDHEWSALDAPLTIDERSMLEFVARDMRGIRALRLITG